MILARAAGNEAVLGEVNRLAQQVLQIAKEQQSSSLLAKSYLLIAKLALLEPDVDRSRDLLARAHQIADEKGYERLAMVIEYEQKRLSGQLPNWLLDQNVPLLERLSHTHLDGLLVALRQNRVEYFAPEDILSTAPSMDELKSFADKLSKRRIEW